MNKVWKLLPALALSIPALGRADTGVYVGGGFGGSRIEQDIGITVTILTETTLPREPDPDIPIRDLNGTDAAFKVFGGFQFGKYFAVEAGYVDLGRAEDGVQFTIPEIVFPGAFAVFQRGNQDREIEVSNEIDGWVASVLFMYPIFERVEVFLKPGLISWDSRQVIQDRIAALLPVEQPSVPEVNIPGAPVSPFGGAPLRIVEDDGTDLAVGTGFNLKASERVRVRGEFEWFDIDGLDQTWMASFAVILKF